MKRLFFSFSLSLSVVGGLILPLTAAGQAEAVDPSRLFGEGLKAFRAGDHAAALRSFKQAQAAGLDRSALFYNIGVCAYRLGRYQEAAAAFVKTAENPRMAALAYYNLGLVALRQERPEEAERWFRKALAADPDDTLRALAEEALAATGGGRRPGAPGWSRYCLLGVGYDDNVEQVTDSETLETSGQGDVFAELLAFAQGPLPGGGATGLELEATGYFLKYADLSAYDVGSLELKIFDRRLLAGWRLKSGGNYAFTVLDGNSFEQVPTVSLEGRRDLGRDVDLRLRYRLSYLDILDDQYSYLSGWRHRLLAEVGWQWRRFRPTIGYLVEANDRDDDDYEPLRQTVMAGLLWRPAERLDLFAGVSYRHSDYDLNRPPDREEEQRRLTFRLTYGLGNGWEASGEYRYTDNSSSWSAYEYTRGVTTVSIGRIF